MVLQEQLYTVTDFLDHISRPEFDGRRFELYEGVIVEIPPSSKQDTLLKC